MTKKRDVGKRYQIEAWTSANEDNLEGRYIRLGNSMVFHLSKNLKPGAAMLYICMCMECGGKRTFSFSHGTAKKYGFASTSFDRYADQLVKAGLIQRIIPASMGQYEKAKFQFMLDWKKGK